MKTLLGHVYRNDNNLIFFIYILKRCTTHCLFGYVYIEFYRVGVFYVIQLFLHIYRDCTKRECY